MSAITEKLAGKVAVVTGASKGIGAEIARALASQGAAVVVNYASSKAGADKVVADITSAGGRAVAVQGDVSKEADIARLFSETKKAFGRVDVLVNNAGVYEFAPLDAITPENFYKQYNLNVLGLLLTTKEAAKYIGDTGGSVINIGSVVGKAAFPNSAVYSSTKAAVDSITRVLGAELGARKIRVNAINPGMIETEGTTSAGITASESDFRKLVEATTPLGRIGRVDDVAPVAVFLASDESKWLTGETIYVSGGAR
jgi:3-oxoacyl-[acyl-carrier protein] reductase